MVENREEAVSQPTQSSTNLSVQPIEETRGQEGYQNQMLPAGLAEQQKNELPPGVSTEVKHREMKKLQEALLNVLGFGVAFALRIFIIGVWLGGWLDRKFGAGKGYLMLACILFSIVFSFLMLYRDLTQRERQKRQGRKTAEKNGR